MSKPVYVSDSCFELPAVTSGTVTSTRNLDPLPIEKEGSRATSKVKGWVGM
jgi:hypothetical protein